jgi:hypothetical protein
MKMKTSELTGTALDWAVAICEGGVYECDSVRPAFWMWPTNPVTYSTKTPNYSTDWSLAGPIIEREGIEIRKGNPIYFPKGNEKGELYEPLWIAGKQHGQTPLIAAMRYHVASKLGDEIEIPEELTMKIKPEHYNYL